MIFFTSPVAFKAYDNWNDFLRALRAYDRVVKVVGHNVYGKATLGGMSSPMRMAIGASTSIVHGMPSSPEAHFQDGVVQLTYSNFKDFEIGVRRLED